MAEAKNVGISRTMFVAGLVAAILASSLISVLAVTQFGFKGPKGDKGDTGGTGPTGPQGPAGGDVDMVTVYSDSSTTTNPVRPNYVDVPGISVNLNLQTTSDIVITFSTEAYDTLADEQVQIQAVLDSNVVPPGHVNLAVKQNLASVYSYSWTQQSVPTGTHMLKMQWDVTAGTGVLGYRTLVVFIIPR